LTVRIALFADITIMEKCPGEIWARIIAYLGYIQNPREEKNARATLKNVSLVSNFFRAFAQAELYRVVVLSSRVHDVHGRARRLLGILIARPDLASAVRYFHITALQGRVMKMADEVAHRLI
jgi:hypothetical protein